MDLSKQSHLNDNISPKAEFRKPSIEAASRKYRRHSPVSYSSSSDGSPNRHHSSSPKLSKDDATKDTSNQMRRKDDRREVERDSNRSQYDRNGDYYRDVDRRSSRRSHAYSRHDDYVRRDKHTGEEERNHRKSSSSSNRESRTNTNYDRPRQESKVDRSREYRDKDQVKYSRDRYDGFGCRSRDKDSSSERNGKRHTDSDEVERDRLDRDRGGRDDRRDCHRSSGDNRRNRDEYNVEFCENIDESALERVAKHKPKELFKGGKRASDGQKLIKGENMKDNDNENNMDKDPSGKELKEQLNSKFISATENSNAKKPKLFGSDKEVSYDKAGLKHTSSAVEKQYLSSKQTQEETSIPDKGQVNDSEASSDLSAAKVAAMKAAELVNKNLVGVGFMSTEQKKKLLWGNKKSNVEEEPGHRWDAPLFTDRERQEKFNKLMGVKGDINVENKLNNPDGNDLLRAEKQKELQLDLEKQYTAGLRRRDGRTVGLGL